jgi:hypothetical protein
MRTGHAEIHTGHAIDIDPEIDKFRGDEPRVEDGGFSTALPIVFRDRTEACWRRSRAPMRRPQALDTPALLIDQHRRLRPTDRFSEIGYQRANLIGLGTISCKQDQSERIGAAE